jgi:high-affinity iron transporter
MARFAVIFATVFFAVLNQSQAENSPRVIVHLLDYLSQDYGGAVAGGKVINQPEYQEQVEFSQSAIVVTQSLDQLKDDKKINEDLARLKKMVLAKAPAPDVAKLAQGIKFDVISLTGLEVAPTHWPDLKRGREVFKQNCVSCHGEKGDGKGPAAAALEPKPTNFLDPQRMAELSPFQAFNTIRVGLPGTAMVSFPAFTDKDVWAMAFYIVSLRHEGDRPQKNHDDIEQLVDEKMLKQIASRSDSQLEASLPGSPSEKLKTLAALRLHSGNENFKNTLVIARSYLQDAKSEYARGDKPQARQKALLAYLEGVEPIEPRLNAADPAVTVEIEMLMAGVRQVIEGGGSVGDLEKAVSDAEMAIGRADAVLNKAAPSPWVTFLIASAIILREGFESVLIIIALLGVIRATGNKKAALWVHGGWVLALACGVLAWLFSGWVMAISGAEREMLEGFVSLVAVLILLYMGFWLHNKTEIGRWKAFIEDRVHAALKQSNLVGLGFISFIAVFREAFETVLFLRALWLEGGMQGRSAILMGVLGSLLLILVLSWALIRYTAKIPIRTLFDYSSALMGLLAFILTGKGLHALQETGSVSITSLPLNFRMELLGFYPTLETTVGQLLVLGMALGLWLYGKKPSKSAKPLVAIHPS